LPSFSAVVAFPICFIFFDTQAHLKEIDKMPEEQEVTHRAHVYQDKVIMSVMLSKKSFYSILSKLLIYSIFVSCVVIVLNAHAQQIASDISSAASPNPVGSGARASGMGGAFIAVADDATAASWNPAGLIQLETSEVSVVSAYNYRSEDTTYQDFPEASGPQEFSSLDLNYFSFAYPFSLFHRNMIVSLNYQHLYDFGKNIRYKSYNKVLPVSDQLDFERQGGLRAISPAYSIQISPRLSLGATLNIWQDPIYNNEWRSTWREKGYGSLDGMNYIYRNKIEDTYRFKGVNFNLGFLWQINRIVTLGGVFKSPFKADLERDYRYTSTTSADGTDPVEYEISFSADERLDMPMSYGIGLATRWSDLLTISFDVYRTEWGDYILHTDDGREISPITKAPADASDVDATTQARLGCEYLFIGKRAIIPLRAGVFYDPEPASGQPDDFWGISLGTGIAYKRVVFDMAYQYRFAENVRSAAEGTGKADQDVQQHTLYLSVIYHF
jgi:long-subunit fatty acid transport protein